MHAWVRVFLRACACKCMPVCVRCICKCMRVHVCVCGLASLEVCARGWALQRAGAW